MAYDATTIFSDERERRLAVAPQRVNKVMSLAAPCGFTHF